MWKKFRGKETPSPIQVGAPVLLESTYDQGQLDRAENIHNGRNHGYNPNPSIPVQREVNHVPTRLPTMQL